MNIKEAGTRSGVSVRNIRFYEQKGLLSPTRNPENDYREYSQEDLDRLKLIRALRMVDMPLETIKEVLSGSRPLSDAASDHSIALTAQLRKLETALRFCEELAAGAVTDVDALLARMDEADAEKLLPRHWTSDYAEALKDLLGPLSVGLISIGFGTFMALAGLFLGSLWLPLLLLTPLGYLFGWGWIGYALCKGEHPGRRILLAHVFPAIFLVCGLYYQMLPLDGTAHPILELGLAYYIPLVPFTYLLDDMLLACFATLALMLLAFTAGAILAQRKWPKRKHPATPTETQA